MTGIYRRILERIEREPGTVLERRVSLAPWEKTWVAFRSLKAGSARAPEPAGVGPVSERAVTVIGGGLAGIAAALELADAGAAVTLLEVRPRLGGAAYSFQRGTSLWLDNGQHVFLRCCDEYRELLRRLGTAATPCSRTALRFRCSARGARAWLRRSGLPAPLHLAGALARYRHLARARALRGGGRRAQAGEGSPESAESDAPELRRLASPATSGSEAAIERLWELISRPTLNLRADETSLAAAAFVFRTGLLQSPESGDIGYARVPLQRIHGDAALVALRRGGVDVRLGFRARAHRAGARRWPARVAARASASRARRSFSPCLTTVQPASCPPGAMRDPAHWSASGSRRSSTCTWSRPAGARARVRRRGLLARAVRVRPHRLKRSGARSVPGGVAVGRRRGDRHLRLRAASRRFAPRSPSSSRPRAGRFVERFVVTRERFATFRAAPGTWRSRPGPRTGIDGLALAGAWTDTGWPATMEGAVRSGRAAARLAAAHRSDASGRAPEKVRARELERLLLLAPDAARGSHPARGAPEARWWWQGSGPRRASRAARRAARSARGGRRGGGVRRGASPRARARVTWSWRPS